MLWQLPHAPERSPEYFDTCVAPRNLNNRPHEKIHLSNLESAHSCLGLLHILRMPNDCYVRAFWLDGSFDRPERPQIRSPPSPRCDGRWCASGFGYRGSCLQRHIDPWSACHIRERKRPVSWYVAVKDYYGSSGADLHPNCGVAREALGPAINPTDRARY